MRSHSILAPLALALLACAGCQTGTVKAVIPIAGGGQITVPIGPQGLPVGEAEGYRTERAVLLPGAQERQAYYEFGLVAEKAPAPSRIRIEDISDAAPVLLVDQANPVFTDRVWREKSETINADDPRMNWVFQITMSYRVYRFTLNLQDGREVSFNHVTAYPPPTKGAIRAKWGEKY